MVFIIFCSLSVIRVTLSDERTYKSDMALARFDQHACKIFLNPDYPDKFMMQRIAIY
jgi:hypothetical protein